MTRIFFYGLFMDVDLLRQRGLNPAAPELAKLSGYGLRIGERATLEASRSEEVYGLVMRLNDSELDQLYSEPGVSDYVALKVTASDMGGNPVPAICYILPIDALSGKNQGYAEALAQVAGKTGLPAAYIEEIQTWAQ